MTNGDVWSFVEADTKIDDSELAAVKASARDKYRSVQRVIDDVATAHAIDTAYFFQPDAFAAPTQERAIKDLYGPDFSIFQQLAVTLAAFAAFKLAKLHLNCFSSMAVGAAVLAARGRV